MYAHTYIIDSLDCCQSVCLVILPTLFFFFFFIYFILHILLLIFACDEQFLPNTHHYINSFTTYLYLPQAMASDPTLRDLQAEIEYEIKLFDKNSREKVARSRVAEEDYVFEHEGTGEGREVEEGKCFRYYLCFIFIFFFLKNLTLMICNNTAICIDNRYCLVTSSYIVITIISHKKCQ
jgi:hypothetical protein